MTHWWSHMNTLSSVLPPYSLAGWWVAGKERNEQVTDAGLYDASEQTPKGDILL